MVGVLAGANPQSPTRRALRLHFEGVVQGVGFRPTVARVATQLGLHGSVRNVGRGVEALLEGPAAAMEALLPALAAALRPPAEIARVATEEAAPTGRQGVHILASAAAEGAGKAGDAGPLPTPPDLRPCAACSAEFSDLASRHHLDPFISCTRCGPRASILLTLPLDRAATTMAAFPRCDDCADAYADADDRRFHAQTCCCPACGPRLRLVDASGAPLCEPTPAVLIAAVHARLRAGEVLAVKGVGGVQLVVDAENPAAVRRLRDRKLRPRQALALMHDRDDDDPLGPIAITERGPEHAGIAAEVAPDALGLGVMPASSPLHRWLFGAGVVREPLRWLVATSGNVHGEPLVTDDADALRELAGVADAFLLHDRAIARPLDDGIVDARGPGPPLPLRLGRGLPGPTVALPHDGPDAIALGGDHAAAFALAVGAEALVGSHVGDLFTAGAVLRLRGAIDDALRLHRAVPRLVVVDAHPGYQSAQIGRALAADWGVPVLSVQHHLAHAASVLTDHGIRRGAALGFDGTGWGPDGTSWGGEAIWLDLDAAHWERVGGHTASPLPGGDAAVRQPSRQTWARCRARGLPPPPWAAHPELEAAFGPGAPLAAAMPRSRSVGRLFDAVAGLLLQDLGRIGYDAEAAVRLEHLAGTQPAAPYPLAWQREDVDGDALFAAVYADWRGGAPAATVAARFHATVAAAAVALAERAAAASSTDVVALAGGVWQNQRLRRAVVEALTDRGLRPLLPRRVPVGDGGLCLGQLAWARAALPRGGDDA